MPVNPKATKLLLLTASLATLALLFYAAYRENYARDWRHWQRTYKAALPAESADGVPVQLRQVYVPALRAADRCISCHVAMAPGESALDAPRLFRAHPNVVHDPAEFGCVTCHGGQGRATETADAHGTVPHWPEPMLPQRYAYAGCGSCHTHLRVPNLDLVDRGQALVERYDCLACHSLDGRGGTLRPGAVAPAGTPDLSRVGGGYADDWYETHLRHSEAAAGGPWADSFGAVPTADRDAIEAFLGSRVGAPGLIEAKALFHTLGCRGCHKVAGVGGDDGPDLTHAGDRDPGRTDFTHVEGEPTLANWFAAHFRAPATIVPGSQMPEMGLGEEQIDRLTFYMLSLRRSDVPEAYWPLDRVRAERLDQREFATDGATLYGTFCAACHGPQGEGMRYPGMHAFPAIGNPDFLAIASDAFIAATVRHGRPGRRMPAWGDKDGGLRLAEIDAVVAHVRSLSDAPAPQETTARRWVGDDAAAGAPLYKDSCASCHGGRGEGAEGPALNNSVLLAAATDTYLVETIRRGRRGTSMPAFATASTTHAVLSAQEIEAIVAFIRTWEDTP
jgi:cbb3-type cytochrome c oxidase subunit III